MLLNKVSLNLAALASKESSRYTMNGLAVRPKDVAVTNGHYAVIVTHPMERKDEDFPQTPGLEHVNGLANGSVVITREAALNASKAIPKKVTIPILQYAALGKDSTLYVNQLDSVQTFKGEMHGQFPNLEAVIPVGEPVAEVALSAEYLETLAKYVKQNSLRGNNPIRLTIYGPEKPVRMDARLDGQDVVMVLMPIRMDKMPVLAKRPFEIEAEKVPVSTTPELEEAAALR